MEILIGVGAASAIFIVGIYLFGRAMKGMNETMRKDKDAANEALIKEIRAQLKAEQARSAELDKRLLNCQDKVDTLMGELQAIEADRGKADGALYNKVIYANAQKKLEEIKRDIRRADREEEAEANAQPEPSHKAKGKK